MNAYFLSLEMNIREWAWIEEGHPPVTALERIADEENQ